MNDFAEECYDRAVEYAVRGNFTNAREDFEKSLKVDSFYRPADLGLKTIKDVFDQKINRQTAIHIFNGVKLDNCFKYDEAIRDYSMAIVMNAE